MNVVRKSLFFILLLMWCFAPHAHAQGGGDGAPPPSYLSTQKKFTLAFQPMQWFNWGWRFDLEMRLGDGPGWIQVGPTIYSKTREGNYCYYGNDYETNFFDYWGFGEPFSKLTGSGLDVNYKRFVDPKRALYIAGGVSYNLFNLEYYGSRVLWRDYVEDGMLYHTYTYTTPKMDTQSINRLGVNYYIGYQVPSRWMFLFDAFIGVSYRYSILDKEKPQFNKSTFSYGYNGFVLMTGVRFGIGITP